MSKYTIFILKRDALIRGLKKDILKDIEKYYDIVIKRDVFITKGIVVCLREKEWKKDWNIYPSDEMKNYCFLDQIGEGTVILCKIKIDNDAINFGNKFKGDNPVAHLCDPESIRGKYADKSILSKIKTDKLNVSYLCDDEGKKIRFAPNIIHSVSNISEFKMYLKIFFENVDLMGLK